MLIDFRDWTSGFLQSKASQDSRPLLDQVCLAKFRASKVNMYFKRLFDEEEYEFADFLMKKLKDLVAQKRLMSSQVGKN